MEKSEKPIQRVALVVDKSGSMGGSQKFVIDSFNEQIQTLKDRSKDLEIRVTCVYFNQDVDFEVFDRPVADVDELNEGSYSPRGSTALHDAIGLTVDRYREDLSEEEVDNTDFLFVIITDGYENSSNKYKGHDIPEMIQTLEDKGWTFTYMGADHDSAMVAQSLNIKASNATHFVKGDLGNDGMTSKANRGMDRYFGARTTAYSVSCSADVTRGSTDGFFDEDSSEVKIESKSTQEEVTEK